jgi:hypothetical protein
MSTGTITARPAAGAGPAGAPSTAFVLAGGVALGTMEAGMVRALHERGIPPDLLAGTSAGALNAAFPASRSPAVATVGELAAIWRGLRRSDILPIRRMVGVWGLCGRGLALSREPQHQRRRSGDSCVSRPGPVPGPLYTAILRHAALVMAALAICAITAALLKERTNTQAPPPVTPDQAPPAEPGMIPLTILEVSRLLAARLLQPHPPGHATHWLNWRRRHQARSRWYHQRAQLARDGGITMVS